MGWIDELGNANHVATLRRRMSEDRSRVVLFLGAGLSFGSSRQGRKSLAEDDQWGYGQPQPHGYPKKIKFPDGDPPDDEPPELILNDDGEPFPTWSRLQSRMRGELSTHARDQSSLNKFFRSSDPLDCAQLFRNLVGKANYFEFLRRQFQPEFSVDRWLTPSHHALLNLGLETIFTTNYDDLIEATYRGAGLELAVSATADEFIDRRNPRPERHLVKIHGTIDRPKTVVLTRDDYAMARVNRQRMYQQLQSDLEEMTHLFVGFGLSDPNVNIILDDVRLATGGQMPPMYTVQGRFDPTVDEYYRSRDINVVWLGSWNWMPDFLIALNPASEPLRSKDTSVQLGP